MSAMFTLLILSGAAKSLGLMPRIKSLILRAATDESPAMRAIAMGGMCVLWKTPPRGICDVVVRAIRDSSQEVKNNAIYVARFCPPSCELLGALVGSTEQLEGEDRERAMQSLQLLLDRQARIQSRGRKS